jgi:5-methylcytosine-specific restriction endonuclease McrBC regulatory subunit McrC
VNPPVLTIPERGHREIEVQTWETLSKHPEVWRMIDQKIISATQLSAQKVRLTGSCFVGRIVLDDFILEVGEKIEGSLASLLAYATFGSFRVEQYIGPASTLGALLNLLVRQFLIALHSYVSRGREFVYEQKRMRGSLASGRLNITGTVGLRARGLRHVLAYDRPTITHKTAKNRIIAAAIFELERLSEVVKLESVDLATARGLSLLFDDCKDQEVLFGERERFVILAHRLLSLGEVRDKDLIALASVILAHQSFDHGSPTRAVMPRAWFLNLENLFEVAGRQVISKVYSGATQKAGESQRRNRIFEKAPEEYKANPDFILSSAKGIEAVGDVKYKVWTESPPPTDLYQLLVHAETYKAQIAFLVFPHDSYVFRDLGKSTTGCHTWLIAVDVRNLENDLKKALVQMSLSIRS